MDYEELGRPIAVIVAAALTFALLALLPRPGYSTSRFLLLAVIAGAGWVGAFGVVTNRLGVALVGVIGLFLFGFWQFTVGLAALPAAVALFVSAAAAGPTRSNTTA
ncbi:hypothetical protein GL213_02140 [Halogeometricum borinquense]|uniref:Uncharacterized protein n=1 Tax=Halogeometricum borinquense TaxID=60847 RepID=A0A6C0UT56_9EURY|nr:hypothetical protein [Halogeometricum borinquense]QIB76128.1 hypothetical protein G3I44_18760 [Halogeometricum borinquense]QIQ75436.1 hypothetical protein GL213_02140 [Halogeometricum borinquense]